MFQIFVATNLCAIADELKLRKTYILKNYKHVI